MKSPRTAKAQISPELSRDMVCSMMLAPTVLNIRWDCPEQEEYLSKCGGFAPKDMIAIRFATYKEVTFFAFPRYRPGVAATLLMARLDDMCRLDPSLTPFPSYQMNNLSSDCGIVSVVDLVMDDFDVLWALDTGVANSLSPCPETIAGPSVLAFCPKTGALLARVSLCQFASEASRFQHIQAEVTADGKTFLYVADAGTRSIVVWSVDQQTGYKVVLPEDVTDFPLKKDVLYIALVARGCEQSVLFFTYLMGRRVYSMRTCHLRQGKVEGAVTCVGRKPAPMLFLGTDGGKTLYLRIRKENNVFLWNTDNDFQPTSLVLAHKSAYPTLLPTHVGAGYRNLVWALESNFNDYMEGCVGSLGAYSRLLPLFKFCDEGECRNS